MNRAVIYSLITTVENCSSVTSAEFVATLVSVVSGDGVRLSDLWPVTSAGAAVSEGAELLPTVNRSPSPCVMFQAAWAAMLAKIAARRIWSVPARLVRRFLTLSVLNSSVICFFKTSTLMFGALGFCAVPNFARMMLAAAAAISASAIMPSIPTLFSTSSMAAMPDSRIAWRGEAFQTASVMSDGLWSLRKLKYFVLLVDSIALPVSSNFSPFNPACDGAYSCTGAKLSAASLLNSS